MTLYDAALLATAGARNRRFLASAIRILQGRPTDDDLSACPRPEADEPVAQWLARVRCSPPDRETAAREIDAAARALLAEGARAGLVPIAIGSPEFPAPLACIPDPPALLWVRGRAAAVAGPSIALVGSRAATHHGLHAARALAGDLVRAGWRIVSGLARGIDAASHAGCLDAGGVTVAVLGCGADRVYPPEHRDLAQRIVDAGALASEFAPGVPPRGFQFPLRNRLISGLAQAVVVIEAGEKSGALITAGAALDQGREVLVVPGLAAGGRNRGGHQLIRDGAKLVESADDILQELGAAGAGGSPGPGPRPGTRPRDHGMGQLPELVEFTVDDVANATGKRPADVLAGLLELELAGKIQRVGGGRFLRSGTRMLP